MIKIKFAYYQVWNKGFLIAFLAHVNIRMKRNLNLSKEELRVLHKEAIEHPDKKSRLRLMAIYHIARGLSSLAVANLLEVSKKTIDRWYAKYKNGGKDELLARHYVRSSSELIQKKDTILPILQGRLLLSIASVQDILAKDFNISRQPTAIRNFLHQCGFKYRKQGHVPGKSDSDAQEAWLEKILTPTIEKCKDGKGKLLFSDAVHFVLGAFVTNSWSCERQYIKSNTGRNRINVLGAVDAYSKEVTTFINTTYINVEAVKTFLQSLHDKYQQKIYIVMDNARYQHCAEVMNFANELDIEILFLPAYSPNLNIIERLWKFAKKTVLYGKFFDSPNLFHQAIRDFFASVNEKFSENLKSLLTLNFQRLPKVA